MRGTKYLSEILPVDKIIKSDKGAFIISPCGSGKSTFAEELIKNYNKCLYLCDTTRLKKGIIKELEMKKICNVDVMTYKAFGKHFNRLVDKDEEMIKQYDLIVGDEIHNLYRYYKKFEYDLDLYRAIELLMARHDTIKKVILTATPSYVDFFLHIKDSMLDEYIRYDFTDDKDIIRYEELYKDYITNYHQIQKILQVNIPKYNLENKKFLIYTPKIETMRYLEKVCSELNMRPICIWSENAKEEMTYKQKKFCEKLLEDGQYTDDYNVLIINASTETGINIRDDVQYVIVDSVDPVTRTQVRNRVRHDIVLITLKSDGSRKEKPERIRLGDEWLDVPLTTKDKQDLTENLELTDAYGRLLRWKGVKEFLVKNGYNIKDTTKKINGKTTKVSIINKLN